MRFAGLLAATLVAGGCGASLAELRGVHASLREQIHAAKAVGAMECAPAELARAQAAYRLAAIDIGQGRAGRAWDTVDAGLEAVAALTDLSSRCAARGKPVLDQSVDPWDDGDGDGVLDDGCPYRLEDLDGFQDLDGCPEPDNDLDTFLDGVDACPTQPEDIDFFQDADGCPEPDNDADGVLDASDGCANEPETPNGWLDGDGCPDINSDLLEVAPERVVFLAPVRFADGTATLLPQSLPALRELVLLLRLNPGVAIRLDAHTDNVGDRAQLIQLSHTRGLSVIEFLAGEGADRARLSVQGHGGETPVTTNRTEVGRRLNARIEVAVVRGKLPPDGVP